MTYPRKPADEAGETHYTVRVQVFEVTKYRHGTGDKKTVELIGFSTQQPTLTRAVDMAAATLKLAIDSGNLATNTSKPTEETYQAAEGFTGAPFVGRPIKDNPQA